MAPRFSAAIVYGLLLTASVAAYLAIRSAGAGLTAPPPPTEAPAFGAPASAPIDNLLHVLVALFAVTALARLLGRLCARVGQPRVVGEIVAGIVLGPSVLGRLAPEVATAQTAS